MEILGNIIGIFLHLDKHLNIVIESQIPPAKLEVSDCLDESNRAPTAVITMAVYSPYLTGMPAMAA